MSKLSIEFDQLREFDTKALHGFESQVFSALDRDAQHRREDKRKGKGKGKRKRRRP